MPFPKQSKELRVIYRWLRKELKASDLIPPSITWYTVTLLKDLDERLTAIEKRQDPSHHNPRKL